MQIQKACLSTLHFEGYNVGNYVIVFDKENGNVVCIAKSNHFKLVEINKNEFAIQQGDTQTRVYKVYNREKKDTEYIVNKHHTLCMCKEREVHQDMEICGVKNIKSSESSWMKTALDLFFSDYEGTMKKMRIARKK
jgi:hypothetical protein